MPEIEKKILYFFSEIPEIKQKNLHFFRKFRKLAEKFPIFSGNPGNSGQKSLFFSGNPGNREKILYFFLEIPEIGGKFQTLDLFRIQCDLMYRRRWGVRAPEGWTATAATMGRTSPRWRVVQACMYRDRFRFSIMCFELCQLLWLSTFKFQLSTCNFQVSTCNFQVNFQPSAFDWLQVYCYCILSVWLPL